MKEKTLFLEFNDETTLNYTFKNPPTFTSPYDLQAYKEVAKILFEAINNMTQNCMSNLYTFKDLHKINGKEVLHYMDEEGAFDVPVFNEPVINYIIEYFSGSEENIDLQSAGEIADSVDIS